VGYDTNVLTGGAGARYFGIGGSGEYRKDQVTVYLRAVSTQSGRVLKTVHTTKTILSQKVDGGAFLFVDQDRLLETEAGYSFNEPPVLAVTEAIDQAVRALVLEGIREGIWSPADAQSESVTAALEQYAEEADRARRRDYFDRLQVDDPRPGVGIGSTVGLQRYQGDYRNPEAGLSADLRLRLPLAARWKADLTLSTGEIRIDDVFDTISGSADLGLTYVALPRSTATPYLHVGGGVRTRSLSDPLARILPQVSPRAGVEVLVTPRLGLDLSAGTSYTLGDDFDDVAIGRYVDSVWHVRAGLTLYTGLF
jgi:curli production assembly/transport component CsgG